MSAMNQAVTTSGATNTVKVSHIHVYGYAWQPFTNFDACGFRIKQKPRKLFRCHECNDRRRAENLEVQAYYDYWRVRCKDGKHPGWT